VLAADEDFSTYRLPSFELTTGPHAGEYPAGEFGFTRPMRLLDDGTLNGPTIFGGYGCSADNDIPVAPGGMTLAPDEEAILVLSRGPQSDTADASAPYPACTFQEKAENAAAKGWDAVLIGNHHAGADNGNAPDAALCGSGTFADIIGVCIGHRAMHFLFDDPVGKRPEDYSVPYDNTKEPQVGDLGAKIETASLFDGWGYTHLYRNTPGGNLVAIDHFAIEEGIDERYAFGFGDLSVHEFATDPDVNVAYSSYYAGGMRVFTFGERGLEQTGKFIDHGGNNFWGVEVVTTSRGERLFAGSDRDFGLYLLRYTGPGAFVRPPAAASPSAPRGLSDPRIMRRKVRVSKRRYARIRVSCPPTTGSECGGQLAIHRRGGMKVLARRSFTKTADVVSGVRMRLSKAEFRRLVKKRRQRVNVELLTRGSDGRLRHAEVRITLLAPRR
jgi:hypothetical protein